MGESPFSPPLVPGWKSRTTETRRKAIDFVILAALTTFVSVRAAAVESPHDRLKALVFDFVRIKACQISWNYHVQEVIAAGTDFAPVEMQDPLGAPDTLDTRKGRRYAYRSNSLAGADVCGSYFIPDDGNSGAPGSLSDVNAKALAESAADFTNAAGARNSIAGSDSNTPVRSSQLKPDAGRAIRDALSVYRRNLESRLKPLHLNISDQHVLDGLPITVPPASDVADCDRPGLWAFMSGRNSDAVWAIRLRVAKDVAAFDQYLFPTPK